MMKNIDLFVGGRALICGDHADWVGTYRDQDPRPILASAIAVGLPYGLYAGCAAGTDGYLSFQTVLPGKAIPCSFRLPMEKERLISIARSGDFRAYIAGVAAVCLEKYPVIASGMTVNIYRNTLPVKKGLSSSSAATILVARAFGVLYGLDMNQDDEAALAYRGERLTSSECGVFDFVSCAYGSVPCVMNFETMEHHPVSVGADIHLSIIDLNGSKDTCRILHDLNDCYRPERFDDIARSVRYMLGPLDRMFSEKTCAVLKEGNAAGLGSLFNDIQQAFDRFVAPACPSQLTSPIFHSLAEDPVVRNMTLGIKGTGSHGDGCAIAVLKDPDSQRDLAEYLLRRGMTCYALDIPATGKERKCQTA